MHYVFLETIDDDFFKRIAEKNCTQIAGKLIEDYKSFIKQDECGHIDEKKYQEYIKDDGKNIFFINCYLLFGSICVNYPDCCTNHITVLLSNQAEIIVNIMQESINNAKDGISSDCNDMQRLGIQRIQQRYTQVDKLRIENIDIPNRYARNNPNFWSYYIKKAKKYGKKAGRQELFYIRADDVNSDFLKFKNDTGFINLLPCDTVRSVV